MNLKKSKKKSLINVKNDDKECFLSCHITHLNPLKRHPERITQGIDQWLIVLIMVVVNFLSLKKLQQD